MKVRDLFGRRSVASARHRKVQSLGDPVEIAVLVLRLASGADAGPTSTFVRRPHASIEN